jgi:hypothetical protein
MVRGPLSHSTAPSVRPPASASMRGPMAATSTDGAGTSGAPPMPSVTPDQMSPAKSTFRSVSVGSSTDRYSDMWVAGWSNGTRRVASIGALWASPMPRASRPPAISWVVSAWAASISGCRNHVGTTAVPSSIVEVARPTAPSRVRASGDPSCAIHHDEKPPSSAATAWAT